MFCEFMRTTFFGNTKLKDTTHSVLPDILNSAHAASTGEGLRGGPDMPPSWPKMVLKS